MKKRRWKLKKGVWLALLGILALSLLFWEIFGGGFFRREGHFVEVARLEFSGGIQSFYPSADGIFVMDNAGHVSFYFQGISENFRHAHSISDAVLFVGDGFAAVTAQGILAFSMYDSNGLIYTAVLAGEILRFAIGANGYAVAVIRADGGFETVLIDPTGRYHTIAWHEGAVPVAVAMQNGIIAVAQTDMLGANINSTITLIAVSSSAGQYTGEIAAISLINPNQVIGQLHFMDDALLAVSNSRVFGISVTSGDTLWEKTLNNRVESFFLSGNYFAMAYGSSLLNHAGHLAGTVNVYDAGGRMVFSTFKEGASNVYMGFGQVIIQSSNTASIYSINTNEKIEELQITGNAAFVGGQNRICIHAPTGIRIFERR